MAGKNPSFVLEYTNKAKLLGFAGSIFYTLHEEIYFVSHSNLLESDLWNIHKTIYDKLDDNYFGVYADDLTLQNLVCLDNEQAKLVEYFASPTLKGTFKNFLQ